MLFKSGKALLITTLVLGINASAFAQQGPRATPVVTAEAQLREMAPIHWAAGTVVSRDEALVAAEVEGRLLDVAREGTLVDTGAILARLDDSIIRTDLDEAEAIVAREQANLTFLKREVERLQRLAKQNNAAQTQLEQTLADHDATLGELAAAEARRQLAKTRLERTALHAPFGGVVVARQKRAGEWVNSGDAVLQITSASALEIVTSAPLALKPYLHPGSDIRVTADGLPPLTAQLAAVVPVADNRSRLLEVRLNINDPRLTAGQPVRVALPAADRQQVLSVPRDALVLRRGGNYLFKLNAEQMPEQVPVEIGFGDADFIQVKGNLQAGEQVITRGNERLRPGMPVMVKNAPADKAGSAQ